MSETTDATTDDKRTKWRIQFEIDLDSNLEKEQIEPWIESLLVVSKSISRNHPLADQEIHASRSGVEAIRL